MTCFHPLTAYKSHEFNFETGKYGVTFNPHKALVEGSSFKLGCNQCRGCRRDHSQQWAMRCNHEAQMHERSCFLTLTYDDEHLPADYGLQKRDLQLFHMRVQEFFGPGKRYYGCGEYGDELGRPHYHTLLYGVDFSEDREFHCKRDGHRVWTSARLQKLWPHGLSEIGTVTPQSAGYCARYALKKITGALADDHYLRASPVDGQVHRVEAEFSLMSRRPGIGSAWFDRFRGDVYPSGFLVVEGRKVSVPKFYRERLQEPEQKRLKRDRLRKEFGDLAARRRRRANETPERLAVREVVLVERMSRLVRSVG